MKKTLHKQIRPPVSERTSQLRWGLTGIAALGVILAICAALYLIPFGKNTFHAEFTVSGGIRVGDQVRVAGVQVGKVDAVKLDGAHVVVDFTVDDAISLGDASTLQVHLLTAVGGHYLALKPTGDRSLPGKRIPITQTSVPYAVTDIINTVPAVITKIDTEAIRKTIDEVNQALSGQPGAIKELLTNTNALLAGVAASSDDLDAAFAMSKEYLAIAAAQRDDIIGLIRVLGVMGLKLGQYRTETSAAVNDVAVIIMALDRPTVAYADGIEPTVVQLEDLAQKLRDGTTNVDTFIEQIRNVLSRFATVFGAGAASAPAGTDEMAPPPTTFCVPVPGKGC